MTPSSVRGREQPGRSGAGFVEMHRGRGDTTEERDEGGCEMIVLIAPDKFAGTLTAAEAAQAIAAGWRRARPGDELRLVPMADGGEGTIDVLMSVAGHEIVETQVCGPLGDGVMARWMRLPNGTGIVEAAEACGLDQLPDGRKDPLRATTFGVGELIHSAARTCDRVVVTVGGTASVDGGSGCLAAMGGHAMTADAMLDARGGPIALESLTRVQLPEPLQAPVVVGTDVEHPLLGIDGAARVFGPQKGASESDVQRLDSFLSRYADRLEASSGRAGVRDVPGAGAGGGLAFGLAAGLGASIVRGAELVGELVGIHEAIRDASLLVTGEGALDAPSLEGKAPGFLLRLGREHGVSVAALAGRVVEQVGDAFDLTAELGPEGLVAAVERLETVAEELAERAGTVTGA